MATIPIRDIPTTISTPTSNDLLVVDNGVSMGKATVGSVVDARAPTLITNAINALNLGTASQQNVEAFATASQGALADSAVQPSITISAGAGLTGGGTLAANRTIALSSTSIASLALADSSVQPSRQITVGTGLTGGGTLAADRNIALSAGTIASLGKADSAIQALGGSTGQVLTKNSNADNDVAWQTVAAATAVSYAPQTLNAAQQGQAQANIGAYDLTGDNDAFINGNFDVWQAGTSFNNSNLGNGDYGPDCWKTRFDASLSDRAITRQAFTLGQTLVPGNPKYFTRYAVTATGTGGTIRTFETRLEGVTRFSGQKRTLTMYASASTALVLPKISISQNFGTGGSPSAIVETTIATNVSIGTAFAKIQYVVDIPSITGKTLGTNGDDQLAVTLYLPPAATFSIDFAHCSFVLGDASAVSDPFPYRDYQRTLSLCQRYYRRVTASQRAYAPSAGSTVIYGGTITHQGMRATPAITLIDAGDLTSGATQALTAVNADASRYTITANTVSGDFRQLGAIYGLDARL